MRIERGRSYEQTDNKKVRRIEIGVDQRFIRMHPKLHPGNVSIGPWFIRLHLEDGTEKTFSAAYLEYHSLPRELVDDAFECGVSVPSRKRSVRLTADEVSFRPYEVLEIPADTAPRPAYSNEHVRVGYSASTQRLYVLPPDWVPASSVPSKSSFC